MSVKAMAVVWQHFRRGGSEQLAMLALADWCDDAGESLHPSIGAIAIKIGASPDQARRWVRKFEREGLLEVVANRTGGAPGTTPRYRLRLDRIAVLPDPTGSTGARGTGGAGATPGTDATGGTGARDGLHPCTPTAGTGASQSVSRTIKNHQRETRAGASGADSETDRALSVPLPEDFPDAETQREAVEAFKVLTAAQVAASAAAFRNHYRRRLSDDWDAEFATWLVREVQYLEEHGRIERFDEAAWEREKRKMAAHEAARIQQVNTAASAFVGDDDPRWNTWSGKVEMARELGIEFDEAEVNGAWLTSAINERRTALEHDDDRPPSKSPHEHLREARAGLDEARARRPLALNGRGAPGRHEAAVNLET